MLAVVAEPDVYMTTEEIGLTTGAGRAWHERDYDIHGTLLNRCTGIVGTGERCNGACGGAV